MPNAADVEGADGSLHVADAIALLLLLVTETKRSGGGGWGFFPSLCVYVCAEQKTTKNFTVTHTMISTQDTLQTPRTVNVAALLAQAREEERKSRHPNSPESPDETEIPETLEQLRIAEETDHLLATQTLRCGKYRGRTFATVTKMDRMYCKWVARIEYAGGDLGRFQRWLIANHKQLQEEQLRDAREATGTLSQRVRRWDVDQFVELGLLTPVPVLVNATYGKSRRPRQPMYSLETAGVTQAWEAKQTQGTRQQQGQLVLMLSRFLSYVFRRMVHEERKEPVEERLIADAALGTLERNYYAYKIALEVTGGDPDKETTTEAVQAALDRKRAKGRRRREALPETVDFSRLGRVENGVTPRRILLRFYLTVPELQAALVVYRDLSKPWDAPEVLQATWTLTRADGAFAVDRVSNLSLPPQLLDTSTLGVYKYMRRVCFRDFARVASSELQYSPCLGMQDGNRGCPVEADMVLGETVIAFRGGLWVNSERDMAYLHGYAALARAIGSDLNRMCIYFWQHGTSVEADITDWDEEGLLEYLQPGETAPTANACELGMCDEPTGPLDAEERDGAEDKETKRTQRRMQVNVKERGRVGRD